MPRFVAKPVVIEAIQFTGTTTVLPYSFRQAMGQYRPDGRIDVITGDGVRPCKFGDWIMRGPDGTFSVIRASVFETMFDEIALPPALVGKRAIRTKETV